MRKAPTNEEKRLTLTVNVTLVGAEGKELTKLLAYAYDHNGQFITKQPLALPNGKQGQVKLDLPGTLLGATARVVLGPVTEEQDEAPSHWLTKLLAKEGQKEEALPGKHRR